MLLESREACRTCGKSYRECWNCKGFVGQEFAFDVDPENISCPYHGDIEEKMKQHQGLSFCMYEFKAVKKQTALLHQELKKRFSKMCWTKKLRCLVNGKERSWRKNCLKNLP